MPQPPSPTVLKQAEALTSNHDALVAQINALPEPLRQYVHDLETNADPAGEKMRLLQLEENVAGLTAEVERKTDEIASLMQHADIIERQNERFAAEIERLTRERDRYCAAVEWVLMDMAYKAPEQMNAALAMRWADRLRSTRSAEHSADETKEPPIWLLMSMAIRMDHALGILGYYDSLMFSLQSGDDEPTHAQRLEAALTTCRQLWEEVVGRGFYKPEKEAGYVALRSANSGSEVKAKAEPGWMGNINGPGSDPDVP